MTNWFSHHYSWSNCTEAWIREIKQNDGSLVMPYQARWEISTKKLMSLKDIASNEYPGYLSHGY